MWKSVFLFFVAVSAVAAPVPKEKPFEKFFNSLTQVKDQFIDNDKKIEWDAHIVAVIPEGEEEKLKLFVKADLVKDVQVASTIPQILSFEGKTHHLYKIPVTWLLPKAEIEKEFARLPMIYPTYRSGSDRYIIPTGLMTFFITPAKKEKLDAYLKEKGFVISRTVTTGTHGTSYTVRMAKNQSINALFDMQKALNEKKQELGADWIQIEFRREKSTGFIRP